MDWSFEMNEMDFEPEFPEIEDPNADIENLTHYSHLTIDPVLDTEGDRTSYSHDVSDTDPTLSTLMTMESEADETSETLEISLACNRNLQSKIAGYLKRISIAVNENKQQQEQVRNNIEDPDSGGNGGTKQRVMSLFGKNYFKDPEGSFPEQNVETMKREESGLINAFLKPTNLWSDDETTTLRNSVKADCLQRKLRPLMSKQEIEYDKIKNVIRGGREENQILRNIRTLEESIRTISHSKDPSVMYGGFNQIDVVDWIKIANVDLKCERSRESCKNFWTNVAHPMLNGGKWSAEEDAKLVELADRFNRTKWKEIAELLGTNRSPFMCMQRYQLQFNPLLKLKWTPLEDKMLEKDVKECLRNSNNIPWSLVAERIKTRSADECQYRWRVLEPNALIKKRWNVKLDSKLTQVVEIFGFNWKKVARYVPGKSSAQCRERYANSLVQSLKFGKWSREEDMILWKAVRVDGLVGKWSKIALQYLPNRSDNQILLRYKRLLKYEDMEKKRKNHDNENSGGVSIASDTQSLKLPELPPDRKKHNVTKPRPKQNESYNDLSSIERTETMPNEHNLRKRSQKSQVWLPDDKSNSEVESDAREELEQPSKRQPLHLTREDIEPTTDTINVNEINDTEMDDSEIDNREINDTNSSQNFDGLKERKSKKEQFYDQRITKLLARSLRKGNFTNEFKSKQQSKAGFDTGIEEKVTKLLENALQLSALQQTASVPSSRTPLLPPNRSSIEAFTKLMNCRNDLMQVAKLFQFSKNTNLPKPWERTQLEKFIEVSRMYQTVRTDPLKPAFDKTLMDAEELNTANHIQELLSLTTHENISPDEVILKHAQASRMCRNIKESEEYIKLKSIFTSLFLWPALLSYSVENSQ